MTTIKAVGENFETIVRPEKGAHTKVEIICGAVVAFKYTLPPSMTLKATLANAEQATLKIIRSVEASFNWRTA